MKPLIFDGAYGTYLYSIDKSLDFPEQANITDPFLVLTVHKDYIKSGANCIKTNTFAVNITTAKSYEYMKRLLTRGYELAVSAAENTHVTVFADIGALSSETSEDEYIDIAEIFINAGAKNFLFETLSEASSLQKAVSFIKKKVPDGKVILSFAAAQDGYTKSGNYYTDLMAEAINYGADYTGLNCICGPAHTVKLIKNIKNFYGSLCAMPNAGYPSVINGRTVYIDNADYFSDKLLELYALGVKIVGGCCGTNPNHIKAAAEKLSAFIPKEISLSAITENTVKKQSTVDPPLPRGKIMIAVELDSPVTPDASYLMSAARQIKQCGADFITIPDSPLGKARAGSMMISAMVQRQTGIKVIPHLCCRDRNQLGIKGDLIAAGIEGLRHVLAITGDPVPESERTETKSVFGFNSLKLISFIKSLNENVLAEAPFTIYAALNINAENLDAELRRAEEKIKNGAVCFFTQPIFTDKSVENYFTAKKALSAKIFAGLLPVASYKNALFLNNEVAGIKIPDHVLESLKDKPPETVKAASTDYIKSIIDKISTACDGYYIMTPLKKTDFSIETINYIKGLKS